MRGGQIEMCAGEIIMCILGWEPAGDDNIFCCEFVLVFPVPYPYELELFELFEPGSDGIEEGGVFLIDDPSTGDDAKFMSGRGCGGGCLCGGVFHTDPIGDTVCIDAEVLVYLPFAGGTTDCPAAEVRTQFFKLSIYIIAPPAGAGKKRSPVGGIDHFIDPGEAAGQSAQEAALGRMEMHRINMGAMFQPAQDRVQFPEGDDVLPEADLPLCGWPPDKKRIGLGKGALDL